MYCRYVTAVTTAASGYSYWHYGRKTVQVLNTRSPWQRHQETPKAAMRLTRRSAGHTDHREEHVNQVAVTTNYESPWRWCTETDRRWFTATLRQWAQQQLRHRTGVETRGVLFLAMQSDGWDVDLIIVIVRFVNQWFLIKKEKSGSWMCVVDEASVQHRCLFII